MTTPTTRTTRPERRRRPAEKWELSPILSAANAGDVQQIKALLEAGANANDRAHPGAPNFHGATPLILAARCGSAEVAQVLIDHGAELDAEAGYGSALAEAVRAGHAAVVELLINRGARNFNYSLFSAVEQGHTEVLRIVSKAGVDLDELRSRFGETLLEKAVAAKKTHMLGLLLELGVRVVDGGPLVASIMVEDLASLQLLLKHAADPNQVNAQKQLPLSMACFVGKRAAIELLIEHGAGLDTKDVRSWSCIDWALYGGRKKIAKWLDKLARKQGIMIPQSK